MRIFKVSVDGFEYDEYDAFVVLAEDKEEAIKLCVDTAKHSNRPEEYRQVLAKWSAAKVEEISAEGPSEIILGSYHAG